MEGKSEVERLEAAVIAAPQNHAHRRDLIDALLGQRELIRASEHLEALLAQLPNELWVLRFGIEVTSVTGDSLQNARLKKRLRELEESDDEDEDDPPGPHPGHPSQDAGNPRHLSLVADPAGRRSGHAVETTLRLGDVTGLATVRAHVSELLGNIRTESVKLSGWPSGLLLYGPPSCGKAFIGEVIAGELGSRFRYVDLTEDWTAEDVSALVAEAAVEGSDAQPAVVYLDNLDESTLSGDQLGSAVDAATREHSPVVLAAATFPWKVPKELVGSHRLGQVLLVLPPDGPARRTFLVSRISGRSPVEDADLEWLVAHTEGHSFGDLERLVDLAFLLDDGASALTHTALRTARQRIPSSSSEWLTTAGHHALINKASGLYDDLLAYFESRERT